MRIRIIGIVIFVSLFLVVAGLFYVQVVKGPHYQRLSSQNRIRLLTIESPRGRIFDRNGELLVDNRISFDVAVIPQELKDRERVFKKLSKSLNIPKEELGKALKNNFVTPFQPTKIVFDIGKEKAIMIEEERLDLPGVIIETRPQRHYVNKNIGSHIVGYLGQINSRELTRLKSYGYAMNDLIGRAGIEKFFNNYLRGRHGGMQIEVNNRGYQVGILGIKEPVKGKDIYLTVDIRLQEFVEKIFENARGGACVMDPRDGQILCLVSSPAFDPNLFVSSKNPAGITKLLTSDRYPMLNRLIQCEYPPGSVFKIVTTSAALDKKKITPNTTLSCDGSYSLGGKSFRCWKKKGHGQQTIREAIKNSCNVFFYQIARMAGADNIALYAERYGFGYPTGIDLPDEKSGLVPNKKWKLLKKREPWYEGETLNYAIGQGFLLVNTMQILRMTSVVANGGYLVKPYLVKKIEDVNISDVEKRPVEISETTLNILRDGLIKVVNDEGGTGRRAAVEGLTIAGKTGTAQTSTSKTHAWFTGFAPADNSKAALVVFLEYGGKGGLGASKTASRIFQKMRDLGYL
ncbi:MAG: penicillin-binding protein 2 [Candidatus Omnitrophica bacterium]|nr:penicillin-binding protein 2 [Candidatus Omnitrophota bacterium]